MCGRARQGQPSSIVAQAATALTWIRSSQIRQPPSRVRPSRRSRHAAPAHDSHEISILRAFDFTVALFGTCTFSTPSFVSARMPSTSTLSGNAKLRVKVP